MGGLIIAGIVLIILLVGTIWGLGHPLAVQILGLVAVIFFCSLARAALRRLPGGWPRAARLRIATLDTSATNKLLALVMRKLMSAPQAMQGYGKLLSTLYGKPPPM